MLNRQYFATTLALGVVCFAFSANQSAHAVVASADIARPLTAGSAATFYYSPSTNHANFGPVVQLAPVIINGVPHNVYVEKGLSKTLESGAFQADQILVQGNVSLTEAAVVAATKDSEGKALTLEEIKAIAVKVGDLAREAGVLSNVTVTSETTANGNRLIFGLTPLTVRHISVADGQYFKGRVVSSRLGTQSGDTLDLQKLESRLRQVQTNPDISLETTLEPVEYSNDVDLKIAIKDKNPLHIVAFGNNLGLQNFGNYFYGVSAIYNNALTLGDTISLTPLASRKGTGIYARYETPLKNPTYRLFAEYIRTDVRPEGDAFKGYDYDGQASVFSLGLTKILYDKNATRLAADFIFDVKDATTDASGYDVERDRIRNIRVGLQLDRNDKTGSTFFRNEIGAAFDIFGASESNDVLLSTANAGSQYFRFTSSLVRTQNLKWGTTGILRAIYQYTPDHLWAYDSYFGGGTYAVRGYREGYMGGDSYFLGSLEWRVPCTFLPKTWKLPSMETSIGENTQLVSFVEYSTAKINSLPAGSDDGDQILGVGVGLRTKLTKYVNGRVDIGFPVLRQYPYSQQPRIHFGLDSNIF